VSLPAPADGTIPGRDAGGVLALMGCNALQLVAYFLLVPWVQLQLEPAPAGAWVAGLVVAASWAGILVVSPWTHDIVERLGRRRTLWASCVLSALAVAGLAGTEPGMGWIPWMLLEGLSSGVRWVLAEAMVADRAPAGSKGRLVGWFEGVVGMTFFAGPALLVVLGPDGSHIPWVGLGLAVAGLVVALGVPPDAAAGGTGTSRAGSPTPARTGLLSCLLSYPLLPAIGFVGGFFEAGVSSLLPTLGTSLGMGASQAAWLMAASGMASALAMVPIGHLADRQALAAGATGAQGHGLRLALMRHCAAACMLSALLLPLASSWPWVAFAVATLWGGAGGGLYTLAMIDLGEAGARTLIRMTCLLVMAYTLGGLTGPLVSGAFLSWAPQGGLAWTLACLSAALWLGLGGAARRASHRTPMVPAGRGRG
jgi:MFS family permease